MGQGRRVTDAQVKELRKGFHQGASLHTAAMKAGMDRKTARKYRDLGQLPSDTARPRSYRTRPDPLADVWPRLEALLLREPQLQAKTLLGWLQRELPTQDWQRSRRTLERRVRQWKAQHGPAKEVFFAQHHEPGRLGASDFTHLDALAVTIQGQPFPHLLYHFVLTASNWEHVTLCFSESFASLSEGLQNALWALGGVPQRHRTDRMTLAVHHEGQAEQYTAKYQALLRHYGLTAEATNPASGHENGDCEQGHRRLKEALDQALLLRGSREFPRREDYWQFVVALVAQRNTTRGAHVLAELSQLRPLPAGRLEALEQWRVRVSRGSTIRVKANVYSVPARLIGEVVDVRLGAEAVTVCYGGVVVQVMERLRGQAKHRIDYRHISGWLVQKPGAFARYVYREDLYPTLTFRKSYDALLTQQPGRADKEYVRLLHLATQEGEAAVETALAQLLAGQRPLSAQAVRTLLGRDTPLSVAARVEVVAVDLRQYDALLDELPEAAADRGLSAVEPRQEASDDQGRIGGVAGVPAGVAPAGGAGAVRRGGPASDGRELELCGLPAGVTGAGMSAAAAAPHRATAEGFQVASGEELVGVGPEAVAAEGSAAVTRAVERGFRGPSRERAGLWAAGVREDTRGLCGRPGTGACGAAGAVDEVRPAGAGTVGGQTRPDAEGDVEAVEPLGGIDSGRSRLRAAEPGGDGSAVLAAGGALRAGQRGGDEQLSVFEVGTDLQGPDDHSRGDRSVGASQRDRGVERGELPGGAGEESEAEPRARG
jgi:transposase